MALSKVPTPSIQVPLVNPDNGCPTPYFQRLLEILLEEKAATDSLAEVTAADLAALELDDLADVNAPTPADGEAIVWDDGAGEWVPGTVTGAVPYKGALVYKSADQTGFNATANDIPITWNTEDYDTDGYHDFSSTVTITIASPGVVTWTGHNFLANEPIILSTTGALPTGLTAGTIYYVKSPAADTFRLSATPNGADINTSGSQSGVHTASNTSRFTIPSGVTKVRLWAHLRVTNATSADGYSISISKNGSLSYNGTGRGSQTSSTVLELTAITSVIEVTTGDYFDCRLFSSSDTSIDIIAARSSFAIEVIEATVPATTTFSGARVRKSANLTAQNLTSATSITFNSEDWDTDGYHDNSSNTDRLTVTTGGYYLVIGNLDLQNVATGNWCRLYIERRNSAATLIEIVGNGITEISATGTYEMNVSAVSAMNAGDYFRLVVQVESDTSADIGTETCLTVMKVG